MKAPTQTETLIDRYLDHSLDEDSRRELNRILAEDRAMRDLFRQRIAFHDALYDEFMEGVSEQHFGGEPGGRKLTPSRLSRLLHLGSLLGIALLAIILWHERSSKKKNELVARITSSDSVNVAPLKRGSFHLEKGFAEVEMGNGARIAIEAGTEIEFLDKNRLRLIEGTLGVDTAQTRGGLTVETPAGQLLDRGGRFGVSNRDSEVRADLFQGELAIHSETGEKRYQGRQSLPLTGRDDSAADATLYPMPGLVVSRPEWQGRFEPGDEYLIGTPRPTAPGTWYGNVAKIVGPTLGITPHEGRGMLQLLYSSDQEESSGNNFCNVQHWVDLRPHVIGETVIGETGFEVVMHVNRVAGTAKTDNRFILIAETHTQVGWQETHPARRWRVEFESDADPATWEAVRIKGTITPESPFIKFMLGAQENRIDDKRPGEIEFDGHFIDDVHLHLRMPPRASFQGSSPAKH